jgi:hypothetical protein
MFCCERQQGPLMEPKLGGIGTKLSISASFSLYRSPLPLGALAKYKSELPNVLPKFANQPFQDPFTLIYIFRPDITEKF